MEGLSYCILHIAKVNVQTQEQFEGIFESMQLREDFQQPFLGAIRGSLGEMREIL